MGNNWVNIILHQRWNLAAARTKHGNAFRDAALMKEFQNQCAYPHSTRECPFWLHLVTIRWRGIWPFHHRLLESQSCQESAPGHVAFLPWRDGASYSQATTTTSLSLSVLTFPSRIKDICSFDNNMELSLSQEVTLGSSVPSSGPNNGEGRAPELIDYPRDSPIQESEMIQDSRTRSSVLVPV